MLTTPLIVLTIRCPSVVYVNNHSHGFNIRCPPVVYVNSPSTDGHLMFKTVRGAVNINYWWTPHA
jgi:hypothetical protein